MSASEWNCSQWRALSPASALNKSRAHSAKLLWMQSFADYANPAVADIVGPCDIIVMQRNFITPDVWAAMEYWRGLGKAIVGDLDDSYPTLPWSNPAHRFWIANEGGAPVPPIELLTQGLRHCDALTSPSRVILDDWKDVVPGLFVPNFAPADWWQGLTPLTPRDPSRVVIGWGGSVSHYDSWWFSGIREALKEVCQQRPQVLVKLCGNDPRLFEQLDVPAENKVLQPGVPAKEWPRVVATFDIGLAPLDLRDGPASYDQRRSWIKGLEYLLAGVPWIASESEPYREIAQYGVMVDNTVEGWTAALLDTIDHLDAAKKRARKNRRAGWERTLERNLDTLVATYDKASGLRREAQLPDVFVVTPAKGEHGPQPVEGAGADAPPLPAPPPARLAVRGEGELSRLQRAAVDAAGTWYRGLGLEFGGVDLGAGMGYDVIQRLNQELVTAYEKKGETAHAG